MRSAAACSAVSGPASCAVSLIWSCVDGVAPNASSWTNRHVRLAERTAANKATRQHSATSHATTAQAARRFSGCRGQQHQAGHKRQHCATQYNAELSPSLRCCGPRAPGRTRAPPAGACPGCQRCRQTSFRSSAARLQAGREGHNGEGLGRSWVGRSPLSSGTSIQSLLAAAVMATIDIPTAAAAGRTGDH